MSEQVWKKTEFAPFSCFNHAYSTFSTNRARIWMTYICQQNKGIRVRAVAQRTEIFETFCHWLVS